MSAAYVCYSRIATRRYASIRKCRFPEGGDGDEDGADDVGSNNGNQQIKKHSVSGKGFGEETPLYYIYTIVHGGDG